jgi:hypothetical protein
MDTKEPSHIIVQRIHEHIDYSIQIKINERNKTDDPEHQKRITDDIETYSKMYSDVDKSGFVLLYDYQASALARALAFDCCASFKTLG